VIEPANNAHEDESEVPPTVSHLHESFRIDWRAGSIVPFGHSSHPGAFMSEEMILGMVRTRGIE
jgi:hypothetical protein